MLHRKRPRFKRKPFQIPAEKRPPPLKLSGASPGPRILERIAKAIREARPAEAGNDRAHRADERPVRVAYIQLDCLEGRPASLTTARAVAATIAAMNIQAVCTAPPLL